VQPENKEHEKHPDLTPYNGRTIASLDLSINDVSSLNSGSLAAFQHLRHLNLSYNSIANLNGIAAAAGDKPTSRAPRPRHAASHSILRAAGLRELNLSMNRLSSDNALLGNGEYSLDGLTTGGGIQTLTKLRSLDLSYNRRAPHVLGGFAGYCCASCVTRAVLRPGPTAQDQLIAFHDDAHGLAHPLHQLMRL
jgi:Leucine-rich repeat (LRR) protein